MFQNHQVKKEQLTKGQKRNAWRKGGLNEEDRQRGWNWVDVIKWVLIFNTPGQGTMIVLLREAIVQKIPEIYEILS